MFDSRRIRLIVDIAPELRRRIRIAAAERDLPITGYVTGILDRVVPGGGKPMTQSDIERFDRVREGIMRGRRFGDDSADILREQRGLRGSDSE